MKVEGAYHGSYDYAEVSLDSTPENWGAEPRSVGYARGTPKGITDDVIVIPFNDVATAERLIRANRESIAAVLMDACPSYLGFVQASKPFVTMIERVTREVGAIFILDEVISFRVHRGGAQTLLGIKPDLTVLAKIIGVVFPSEPSPDHANSCACTTTVKESPLCPPAARFTANPVTMTAGKVTLDLLTQAEIDRVDALGQRLRRGVAKAFAQVDFPAQITGFSSMFTLFGHRRPVVDYRSAFSTKAESTIIETLHASLTSKGYHVAKMGKGFLSTPMTEADVDGFIDAVAECVTEPAKSVELPYRPTRTTESAG